MDKFFSFFLLNLRETKNSNLNHLLTLKKKKVITKFKH